MAIENLTNLFYQQLLPQRIQSGDLSALKNFVRKFDDDDMTTRAAVMATIREMTAVAADGQPQDPTSPQGRQDIMRLVRSLNSGGIPGNAEGQPPSALPGPIRRQLAQAAPGGTAT